MSREPTCKQCGHGSSLHGGTKSARVVGERCWRKRCRCMGYVADRSMKVPGPRRKPAPVLGPGRKDFVAHVLRLQRDLIRFRQEVYGRLSRAGLEVWPTPDGGTLLARNAAMCGAIAERGGDARYGRWVDGELIVEMA